MSDLLIRAGQLLQLHRAVEAEKIVRDYLVDTPHSADALRLLGRALLEQERPIEALTAANAAIAADPEASEGQVLVAVVLSALDHHDTAARAAREAVRLAPLDWETHAVLAGTLVEAGSLSPDALRAADEACRLAPHEAAAHVVRGLCLARSGRDAEAADSYREALRLDPDDASALNNLAVLDISRGRMSTASAKLTAALTGSPQATILRDNLDVVLLQVIRWNYFLVLAAGALLAQLAQNDVDRGARGAILAAALVLVTANLLRVVRYFPRGSRRWMFGLVGRADGSGQYLITLSVIAAGLVIALGLLDRTSAAEFGNKVHGFFVVGIVAGVFWTVVGRRRED